MPENEDQNMELSFTEVKQGSSKFPNFPNWSPKKGDPKVIFGLLVSAKPEVLSKYGASPFTVVCPANPDPKYGMPDTKIFSIWAVQKQGNLPGGKSSKLFDLLNKVKEQTMIRIEYKGVVKTKSDREMDDWSVGELNQKVQPLIDELNKFYQTTLVEFQESQIEDDASANDESAPY